MICRSFPIVDPLAVFAQLAGQPFAHMLAGGRQAEHSWGGAWDVIVAAPVETLVVDGGMLKVNGEPVGPASEHSPFEKLNEVCAARRKRLRDDDDLGLPIAPGEAGFLSGGVGYLSYEMARYLEPSLKDLPAARTSMPEMAMGFYDAAILFHRPAGKAFLIAMDDAAADRLQAEFGEGPEPDMPPDAVLAGGDPSLDYIKAVRKTRERILDGTIFQANITRQLEAVFPDTDWRKAVPGLFRRMHNASASPYGAVLQFEEGCALSDSPEKFLQVKREKGELKVIAEPVKGTRPRHEEPEKDKVEIDSLLSDEKDRAENVMIADLVRNDLSRVCRDHSIMEEAVCELQSFANVHHLVSRISGILDDGLNAIDALAASYPCGSITGAPKISAMKTVADLEVTGRGIYCGAIGYFDDRGGAMISVPIRTATLELTSEGAHMTYGTGGGITVLSDPETEYQETVVKARPFLRLAGRQA